MRKSLSEIPLDKIVRVVVEQHDGTMLIVHGAAAQSVVSAAITELGDDIKGYIERQPSLLEE